ncbi:hypothetical protein EVAR_82080_1 [Eumeta japonica]|uniref:Uncharacterized protein n=1 Tax=Eumeta variegata TaxID=151549 RepID=A0A4C1U230_EUMVA|nr:hypothetical protein EVAR_82080_1 [Eumeta japonica]
MRSELTYDRLISCQKSHAMAKQGDIENYMATYPISELDSRRYLKALDSISSATTFARSLVYKKNTEHYHNGDTTVHGSRRRHVAGRARLSLKSVFFYIGFKITATTNLFCAITVRHASAVIS